MKMRCKKIFYMIILNLLVIVAYNQTPEKNEIAYEEKIDVILNQLSLEEKIAMLHGNSLFTSSGVKHLGIPDLQYSDGPHGIREEQDKYSFKPAGWTSDSATFFPTGTALAATWNCNLMEEYGKALGEEARARDKDVLLGPGANIIRTPLCGRNYEYFSEDPFLNAKAAVSYIRGVQSNDVAACIKHYLANNQEKLRWRIDVHMDERALREIYLPAYKAAVQQANVWSIMGAYNKFRGYYCCQNKYILKDILKDEWGFKGIVISDWGATHSTVRSAISGLDVEMGTYRRKNQDYYFGKPLLDSLKSGKISESLIDDKVRRILRVMLASKTMDKSRKKGSINTPEHSKIAYRVASESIVLLKNDAGILPLDMNRIKTIAVIGDNATRKHASGGFSAGIKARYEIAPLTGLQNKVKNKIDTRFAQGYEKQSKWIRKGWRYTRAENDTLNEILLAEAVEAAGKSDLAIIFAGLNHDYDTETIDRPHMKLPYAQDQVIKAVAEANPRTIVVLVAGSPLDLSEIVDKVPAILWTWYGGSEGGNAIADVLFGKINPSGRLPFTIPERLEDSPAHYLDAYPGDTVRVEYKEGILVGYRWYDTRDIKPLFCFGYGLSYTDFTYLSIETDKQVYKMNDEIVISLGLNNSGDFPGSEVVQLYIKDMKSSVLRPLKELKGFRKIFLQPEEEQKIDIRISAGDLAFYDDNKMEWVVEPGEFTIMAGSSSRDIRLSTVIFVE